MPSIFYIFLSSADNCRIVELNVSIASYTLLGHVFKRIEVTSPDVCEVNCFIEADCVSLNVGPLKDGKHWCELSDSDHIIHPENLVYGNGMTYVSFKVREKSCRR